MSEEAKRQLGEFVKLQVYDDKYIDRKEEKKILEEAMKRNISIDDALAVMRSIASAHDYVVERDVETRCKEMLEQFAGDGKVDKKEFEDAVGMYKKGSRGRVPESEIRRRLKSVMIDQGWKAKEGGLFSSKWFSEIS
jgi:Rps23 Pro-64 3,4-dihydroxylase Tpa1-like proline 4-hydroxylase